MLLRKAHSPGCRQVWRALTFKGVVGNQLFTRKNGISLGEIVLCVIVTRDNRDNIYLTSSATFGKRRRSSSEWSGTVGRASIHPLFKYFTVVHYAKLCACKGDTRTFKKYLARFRNISSKYNRINDLSSSNLSLFYRYIIKIHLQSSIFLPRDFVILFILQDAGAPFVALYTFFTRQRWSSARPERSRAARSDDTRMRKV